MSDRRARDADHTHRLERALDRTTARTGRNVDHVADRADESADRDDAAADRADDRADLADARASATPVPTAPPAPRRPVSVAFIILGVTGAIVCAILAVLLIRDQARDQQRQELACQVQRLGGKPIGGVECPPTVPPPSPPVVSPSTVPEPPAGAGPVLPPQPGPGLSARPGAESPAQGSTAPPPATSGPAPTAEPGQPADPPPAEPEPSPDVQVCAPLAGCTDLDLPLLEAGLLDTPLLRLMPTA